MVLIFVIRYIVCHPIEKIVLLERYYYSGRIEDFITESPNEILGELTRKSPFAIDLTQTTAWLHQIDCLKLAIKDYAGRVFFEYAIPRMGRRVDVILIISKVIFVLEFKVGESQFLPSAIDQVWDYALDLKNFHETSHDPVIAPILVATEAEQSQSRLLPSLDSDNLISPPLLTNSSLLSQTVESVLQRITGSPIDELEWDRGGYSPTPTIIEAATALYNNHSVENISRSDASAKNLRETSAAVRHVIERAEKNHEKSICFVTGVPGAGKTLVGLDIATKRSRGDDSKSVFLSGNGPLVEILREALVRDSVRRAADLGRRLTKKDSMRSVIKFIQNVHHYRDEYLKDSRPPYDHVAIFDEAQRAWNLKETVSFMLRKKGIPDFDKSEPEFLISCLNRHHDWAVIVCLVGGGQEINRGEAGIGEWIESLNRAFPDWHIYVSDRLSDSEYAAGHVLEKIQHKENVHIDQSLHLNVSMRSYRAENVSSFVKATLDMNIDLARELYQMIRRRYPVVMTRDLQEAKQWLKDHARGSERYGLLASSSAERLKAKGIHVKAPMKPVNWFLEGKDDVRSSYFLEDVATEFQVQGLELDWSGVLWDADFRFSPKGWGTYSFSGSMWKNVIAPERKQYLTNAYRVLLTRARQGMILVIPEGESEDITRLPHFYDSSFDYLRSLGIPLV